MRNTITAEPKTIRDIFSKEYVIPEFQRRYSWDKDQCERLWDDIIGYHETRKESDQPYFLGTIVIYSCEKNEGQETFIIIDGQQRLTSLLLLIKAMHNRALVSKPLEKCLKKEDHYSGDFINELRVESDVIDEDKEQLKNIIINDSENKPDSIFSKNFNCFKEKIEEWFGKHKKSEKFSELVLTLLDHIHLLPIKCGNENDAMTIFQTINDRGMKLDDSDIFKAKIYNHTDDKKKKKFINRWNDLASPPLYTQVELFRRYMHILRAKDGVIEKEVALRTFFSKDGWSILKNQGKVVSDIEKIAAIEEWAIKNHSLWNILYKYPNIYWRYPLIVFLHKHGDMKDGDFILLEDKKIDFNNLIEETIKYLFIKGIVYNSVNKIKDTIFKVCKSISNGDSYVLDYENGYEKNDMDCFKDRIKTARLGKYMNGLVLIGAYLNEKQDEKSFLEMLENDNWHIEHILPRKWKSSYYGNWDDEKCNSVMNKLGNLIPLEKKLNIKAGNHFFGVKAECYEASKIQDAIDLAKMVEQEENKEWLYEDFENRQNEILKRFETFFSF